MTDDDRLRHDDDPSSVAALDQLAAAERSRRRRSGRPAFRVPNDLDGIDDPTIEGHTARPVPGSSVGRQVGRGWHSLIEELNDALEVVDPRCRIIRVGKDVEGLLEVEVNAPSMADPAESSSRAEQIGRAVRTARRRSATTCEITGGPGQAMVAAGRPVIIDPLIAPDRFAAFAAPPVGSADPNERIEMLEHLLRSSTEVAQRLLDELRWLRSHGMFPEQ